MPALKFIPNAAGEGEGLSDAGIETYRDNPFPAVARETGQNSRDAHDRKRCADKAVRVEIDKVLIPAASLPAHADYLRIVRQCLATAEEKGTKKEVAFFSQAERVLTAEQIPILRIADYNTRGLRGPCEEGHPFHALVKSSGISDKPDDTSGGSFGIGKSAVYAASDLQTVFYSTAYPVGEELQFLCQGKTKFRSFVDQDGEPYRSVGYWGEPAGFLPVSDPEEVPEWLRRDEVGTTVCSIAVRDTDDWQKEVVASLVVNFFSAIHAGRMEFVVQGEPINANTLRRRFDDPTIATAADEEDFTFARSMYECLTDDHDTEEHPISIPGVGTFRLRILLRDGLPKRLGIIRNGMYITDSLVHFGDRFSRFPMYRDFVAIVEPVEEESNSWLRAMENPRHDELSPERLLEPEQRRAAKRNGKLLAERIRRELARAARATKDEQTDLEELSEFFALDDAGREDDGGARKVESFKVRPPALRKRTRHTRAPLDDNDGRAGGRATGTTPGSGGGGGGPGAGTGDRAGGSGTRSQRKPFPLAAPRTIVVPGDPRVRRILFTPSATGEAHLRFESSGVSEPEPLELDGGRECRVTCTAGQREEVTVMFAEPYDGPVEIVSWGEEPVDEDQ